MNTEAIIGQAGSGKSFLVRQRVSDDPNYALMTASTGIAAVNLGEGVTTVHSALGFYDLRSLEEAHQYGRIRKRAIALADKGRKNLLIDEISMVDGKYLQLIYDGFAQAEQAILCDDNRQRRGIQPCGLVLSGDFCFGKGTPIMMSDGSLRTVENVRRGDRVMTPGSKSAVVVGTTQGVSDLWLVQQTNGDNYIVNGLHSIVMKRGVNGHARDGRWGRYTSHSNDILMTAPELATTSAKFKSCFVGYKNGLVELPPRPISIDPYFLGLWLGDGDSDAVRVTTPDQEIEDFLIEYARALGLTITYTRWDRTTARRVGLSGKGSKNGNCLRNYMRDANLFNNKHIPDDYLLNSTDNRLELLAGLLDSGGCWSMGRYSFTATRRLMAHQVKQLADGLGFRVAIRSLTNGYYAHGQNGGCWGITIGGDTWRIPCRVKRKQSVERNLGRSWLTSTLSVAPLGMGEYFGFAIDSDDHLFLLGDGTVAHNCQLSPVPDYPKQPVTFAFEAPCWSQFEPNLTHLTKVWRQDNPAFLEALQLARVGNGVDAAFALKKAGVEFASKTDDEYDGITLFPVNAQVDQFNARRLAQLPGDMITFPSKRWGKEASEWRKIPEVLELKPDALVMILVNDAPEFNYVNGDLGYVRCDNKAVRLCVETKRGYHGAINETIRRNLSFAPDDSMEQQFKESDEYFGEIPENADCQCPFPKAPRQGQTFACKVCERHYYYFAQKDKWVCCASPWSRWKAAYEQYMTRHTLAGARYWDPKNRGTVIGEIQYMPLRLAYASSTHKAQGLTIDRVQVCTDHFWAGNPGMMYVALSRARSPEGLRVVGDLRILAKRIKTDSRVKRWV